MTAMEIIDRMTHLASIAPFNRLTGRELLLIAQQTRPRDYPPATVLIEAGEVADRLYVVAAGSAMAGDAPAPLLFDAASLLFTLPVDRPYRAGSQGLHALCLAKPHLFTIARECPDFIAGLVDIQAIAG